MKVFLGGTVNDSTWRDQIMPLLKIEFFNPVVKDWNDAAWERELYERKTCDYVLYVLTPKLVGYYSIAEVTDDSFKRPDRTIYCYLPQDDDKQFNEQELITFEKLGKKIEENGAIWLKTLDDVVQFLNSAQNPELTHKPKSKEFYDVFISYGRKHSKDFAAKLYDRLVQKDMNVWFDQNNIPLGVDFQEEINEGIRRSHNFIFVISPHSVKSEYCLKEILLAVELNKRIIPLLHVEPSDCWDKMHPVISKLNWIYFQETVNDFEKEFQGLLALLASQLDYVQKHTELLNKAIKWQKAQKSDNLLLLGPERIEAETWLHTDFSITQAPCLPTDLQCEFICESHEAAHNFQTEIFICYDELDSQLAQNTRIALMRQGITCWTPDSDLKAGDNFLNSAHTAIEKTATVLFFVTKKSVKHTSNNSQLEYASKFNKRIIPVLLEKMEDNELPLVLKSASFLEYFEQNETAFAEFIKKILNVYYKDETYYTLHRDILVKALNWERKNYQPTTLLYGFDLENAKEWQTTNKDRKINAPLSLQLKFISDSERSRISVFISYGRRHSLAFATKLHDKLNEDGFNVWFDKNDIPLGVDFQTQIDTGIENADNFIFVISPHSIKSVYCQKEVVLALKYNKRIIPILHVEPSDCWDQMHPVISKLNWIYCREKEDFNIPLEQWQQIDNFEKGYKGLVSLLRIHSDYVKTHKQVLIKALEWDRNQRQTNHLLFGQERIDAEKWLSTVFKNEQPPSIPSDLHCEFITESKKNANNGYTDVFLCYAIQDLSVRERIEKALARQNITMWLHTKDIQKGNAFDQALREGVEQSDTLVYFISPASLASEYCKFELDHAIKYNKRIIPLLIEQVDTPLLHPSVLVLQHIDMSKIEEEKEETTQTIDLSKLSVTQRAELDVKARKEKSNFEKGMDELVQQINTGKSYFEQHKLLLVKALNWKATNANPSFLVRGNELQNAQVWLKIGQARKDCKPTEIHEEFINESIAKAGQLITEVFLCYPRSDSDFTRKIGNELQLSGKTIWIDQEGASSHGDERLEIFRNIEKAANFVFVVSPTSVKTLFCAEELERAKTSNKRIIAIQSIDTPSNELPPLLTQLEIIDFSRQEFTAAYSELLKSLDTDRDYVEAHTRWAQRAGEWKEKGRNADLLLRGSEIKMAQTWLNEALQLHKTPKPSELQQEFIERSYDAYLAALAKERQRKLVKRLMYVVIFLFILAIIFAWYARKQSIFANEQRIIAEKQTVEAIKQRNNAEKLRLEADSLRRLADLSADSARAQRLIALRQKLLAEAAKIEADRQREIAEKQRKIAELQTEMAQKKQKEALIAKYEAEKAKKLAIDAKNKAMFDLILFNSSNFSNQSITNSHDLNEKADLALTAYDLKHVSDTFSYPKRYLPELHEALLKALIAYKKPENTMDKNKGLTLTTANKFLMYSMKTGYINSASIADENTDRIPAIAGKKTEKLADTLTQITSSAFSADGNFAAVGTSKGKTILYKTSISFTEEKILDSHNGKEIWSICFIPNTSYMLSSGNDNSLEVWDVNTQKLINQINVGTSVSNLTVCEKEYIYGVRNDGKLIQIPIWQISTIKQVQTVSVGGYKISALAYSPHKKWLAAGSTKGDILLLVIADQKVKEIFPYSQKHIGQVSQVCFSPDAQWLASASFDGTIRLINIANSKIQKVKEIPPINIDNGGTKILGITFDYSSKNILYIDNKQMFVVPFTIDDTYTKLKAAFKGEKLTNDQWLYYKRGEVERPPRN